MFAFLAKLTEKYKIAIILVWIVLAAVLTWLAPSLTRVGVTDDSLFLPRDTESIQAQNLLKTRFSASVSGPPGSALIVVHNPAGLNTADLAAARVLNDWLLSPQAPALINAVNSPFTNPTLSATLQSPDNTTLLIGLSLREASGSTSAGELVKAVRSQAAGLTGNTRILVTGGAGIASDALSSIRKTIDRSTQVTVLLVVLLLLIIYRSPVAIFVPLITIGVSYLISRATAGFIAQTGFPISTLVDAYLVVTLFGIGTDYCLFMVSRFKEEIGKNEPRLAVSLTLRRIGPVISASAFVLIVALLCLGISHFGMNRNSGLILAIGVAVTLSAGLTLTPALIAAFGRRLLWPARLQLNPARQSNLWHKIGLQIVRRPIVMIMPVLVLLALPYLAIPGLHFSASMLSQMPAEMESVQGYRILEEKFPTGRMNPVYLLIESRSGKWLDPDKRLALQQTVIELEKLEEVASLNYFASPAAKLNDTSRQIKILAENLGPAALGQMSTLLETETTLKSIALQYPGVIQCLNFQEAAATAQKIAALAVRLNPAAGSELSSALSALKPLLINLADNLVNLAAEFNLQAESPFSRWLQEHYFSLDGTITRLTINTKADPFSAAGIASIDPIRNAVQQSLQSTALQEDRHFIGGTAANQADILKVNSEDFLRVLVLAVIGIFIVTLILLRSLVAPLYMIVTVLFNFGATLGIATWLFIDILQQASVIYMLPIFVFVILVAVGADYNIFLVSRIREEAHSQNLPEAICNAVSRTGGVITSCGVILAGTFASLTTAPLQMVFQVGGAIAIGVIIDTFLIRALLIPAIARLLGRWNWWPSRLAR